MALMRAFCVASLSKITKWNIRSAAPLMVEIIFVLNEKLHKGVGKDKQRKIYDLGR